MMPNFTEMFLRLRRALEFSHDQGQTEKNSALSISLPVCPRNRT